MLPEESGTIINQLLEKYDLAGAQKEGLRSFIESKNPEERIEIFENLPGTKISKLVAGCAEGKIDTKELLFLFKEGLNITEKEARGLTEDLKNKLLISAPAPVKPGKTDVYRESVE